ncbi:MAG: hypothetical protein LCH32_13695 [Bacteroidetes bacterium]|nr:hypothetical protein [Bacteroidota bacterium]
MKKIALTLLIASSISVFGQAKKGKEPKMANTMVPGYYVNQKGDTVKGTIALDSEDETAIYKGFSIKIGNGKPTAITTKKAKAYGFDGRNFTVLPFDDGEVYIEYLTKGRLNFCEYRFMGKINGEPGIESVFFIQDSQADPKNADLKTFKQFKTMFYKKEVKDYFNDQPQIWSDFDKFVFDKTKFAASVKEFNKFYETAAE